jgi:hypothetical protein
MLKKVRELMAHRRRLVGCCGFFLAASICLCAAAPFLYSRFGGSWASSLVIAIPPTAKFVDSAIYEQYGYYNRLTVYTFPGSVVEAREWFTSHRWPMSPIDGVLKETDVSYFSLPVSGTGRREYHLLFTAACLSFNPCYDRYEMMPDCFRIDIYRSLDLVDYPNFADLFPTINASEIGEATIIVTRDCWPMW